MNMTIWLSNLAKLAFSSKGSFYVLFQQTLCNWLDLQVLLSALDRHDHRHVEGTFT